MKKRLHSFHIVDFLLGYIFELRATFQRRGQRHVRVGFHVEVKKKKRPLGLLYLRNRVKVSQNLSFSLSLRIYLSQQAVKLLSER